MKPFPYRGSELFCEGTPVERIARQAGTPLYLYSQSAMERQFQAVDGAFARIPHVTCYAVKANSNLAILSLFRSLGSGFDVVSKGEMMRAIAAGADPGKIVFSGVGKCEDEMDFGLRRGILQFNVESEAELEVLEARARALRRRAPVALRVNPDVEADTHPYMATGARQHKFGVAIDRALGIYRRAQHSPHLRISGIACHIGSQIVSIEPFIRALTRLKEIFLILRSQDIGVRSIDLGGGLGIVYDNESAPDPAAYARAVRSVIRDLDCTLLIEPGRVIVGNAGILVTRVMLTKQSGARNFVVVDAGMNDLIRPSLYGAYHRILPVVRSRRRVRQVDVVGPVCESGDFLALGRRIPGVRAGELLAVMSAGAYSFVLSSNYNSRRRPAEVLARGGRFKIIRSRERLGDLTRGESRRPL